LYTAYTFFEKYILHKVILWIWLFWLFFTNFCSPNQSKARMRLPIRNSNLGPILLAPFRRYDSFYVGLLLAPPLFYPNFGVFPLHQIAHVGVSPSRGLKLFGREIIFEIFQVFPTCVKIIPQRHRRTDRPRDGMQSHNRALRRIAR